MSGFIKTLFRFGAYSAVSVVDTASDTIASAEEAESRLLRLTGTLTATRVVILPHRAGAEYIVWNSTAQSVTMRGPSGTGPTLSAGSTNIIVSDGVDYRLASGTSAAVTDAEYIVASASGGLSNERVATNTSTITVDNSTPSQTKWNFTGTVSNITNTGYSQFGTVGAQGWPSTGLCRVASPATAANRPIVVFRSNDGLSDYTALSTNTSNNLIANGAGLQWQTNGTTRETISDTKVAFTVPLEYELAATASLKQADVTTNSATGATLTVQAQNATGTTSTGGTAKVQAGTGTTTAGPVELWTGANRRVQVGDDGTIVLGIDGSSATRKFAITATDSGPSVRTVMAHSGSGDRLYIGSSSSNTQIWNSVQVQAQTNLYFGNGGGMYAAVSGAGTGLSGAGYLELLNEAHLKLTGTGSSASGLIRAPHNQSILTTRDNANADDIRVITGVSGVADVVRLHAGQIALGIEKVTGGSKALSFEGYIDGGSTTNAVSTQLAGGPLTIPDNTTGLIYIEFHATHSALTASFNTWAKCAYTKVAGVLTLGTLAKNPTPDVVGTTTGMDVTISDVADACHPYGTGIAATNFRWSWGYRVSYRTATA